MITIHNLSAFRRTATMLLLTLAVVGLWASPTLAEGDCADPCDSPLAHEIHTAPQGILTPPGPKPIPDFCACPKEGCDSLLAVFTDYSQGYIDTWEWDFGDPASGSDNISNEENPTHWYRTAGRYTVTLTVTGPGGTVTKSRTDFIIVRTSPRADFSYTIDEGCTSTTVHFTDLSTGGPTWWRWYFGDGERSYDRNPSHTYTAPGTYNVWLKVLNDCGKDSVMKEITIVVGAPPVADFSADPTTTCAGGTIAFTDHSALATTWAWNFGDGATSTEQNPTHVYSTAGVYAVSLTVTNECGSDDTTRTEYIVVNPWPVAAFTSELTATCVDNAISFLDQSQWATSWHWDFGDGESSTDQNPTHSYATPGAYTVALTVTNECGENSITRENYITVYADPVADFSASETSVCAQATVIFNDLSTSATTWSWDFGDGGTSLDRNPSHAYAQAGVYTVTLTVTNPCGEDAETKTEYITVAPGPVAMFTADNTAICTGETVTFTDLSTDAQSWTWDFGDGATSTDRNPSHTYAAPGYYTVILSVANDCGRDDETRERYISVLTSPVADFESNTNHVCVNAPVSFSDRSDYATEWHWDFGDGDSSAIQNPTHSYAAAGVYTISLTVANKCGQDSETREEYITVEPLPVADFYATPTGACVGTTVAFISTSSNATTWHWDFGDGATSTDSIAGHAYALPGTYTITLAVSNGCGDDSKTREAYVVVSALPEAAFGYESSGGCDAGHVVFYDRSTGATSWLWNFGDGTTSTESYPGEHIYTAEGDYMVILTVSNSCGTDSTSRLVHVDALLTPMADFSADPTNTCIGASVAFSDLSTAATSWSWSFGDGSFSTERNPVHAYAITGVYTVSLTVGNECGHDTETKTEYITVSPTPEAAFTSEVTRACIYSVFYFSDRSSDATSWSWTFGDGGTSTDRNPVHSYSVAGVYTVSLTVTNACGVDSETKTEYITVLPAPVADFACEVTHGCVGSAFYFNDRSSNATSWSWTFGDGGVSTDRNPSHTYTVAGVYTVSLTVTNDCGADVETRPEYITVASGPHADFSATPRFGSAPLNVAFTDLSTSELGITSWAWTFGDGGMSTDRNPSHMYMTPGLYTVELRVVDNCGQDIALKTEYITVTHDCSVDFTADPTAGCAPLPVHFDGTFTGDCEIGTWTWDFGDPASGSANAGSGQHVQHTYEYSGSYTVKLTATDVSGDKVVTKEHYIVTASAPKADFEAAPTAGSAPLYVSFTNQSTGTIDSYHWDFGDPASGSDNTSTQTNPYHVYSDQGQYSVSLIVNNECGPDTAHATIDVSPLLRITKTVDKVTAPVGAELTYTLTVRNISERKLYDIHVADTVPDSTTYVAGSITGGGAFAAAENTTNWALTSLAGGAEVSLSFRVVIDGPFTQYPATISNYAVATVPEVNSLRSSVKTFISNTVETVVDEPTGGLSIAKSVSATLASPGDRLTYVITVRNDGPSPAGAVAIFDAIPDSTTYVDGSISHGGWYNQANDSLIWNLGTLAPFTSVSVSFDVTIDLIGHAFTIPNTALVRSAISGSESNQVVTAVSLTPIVITKTSDHAGGTTGDLVRFTITVQNYSPDPFTDVHVIDTLPSGLLYVDGTSIRDGKAIADPVGDNPLDWALGDLAAGGALKLEYTALIGASAHPGVGENVARASAYENGILIYSNRAIAQIHVVTYTLSGSIRGRVIVDCDGDGVADIAAGPTGMDIFLDDGSQSRVNKEGIFYFSTVRAGEHVVALDERDLDGWYVPEGAQSSVFVHVQETGESYVIFRVCPDYPRLTVRKSASIIPTVTITKTATFDATKSDTLGAVIDYRIDVVSNGRAERTPLRLVDSLPGSIELTLPSEPTLTPARDGDRLTYQMTAAEEHLNQSVRYSLRDLASGERRFLTNKARLEADLDKGNGELEQIMSNPAEVTAGPFRLAPSKDVMVTLTPALFITSKADLLPAAIPQLHVVADSIDKYADADIKVEGHTDYRRIHTKEFPSNWELGAARAKAVVDWLVANRGVARERLSYESFAATRPVVRTGKTSEQLQPNRRTEVIIKARVGGLMDTSALVNKVWRNSTTLPLKPVHFDTLFEQTTGTVDTSVTNSWEVALTVQNTGIIAADNVTLSDVLPDGAEYVENSALLDGKSVAVVAEGKTLSLTVARVEPSQKLELRYRIRALQGQTPTGGGAASVTLTTGEHQPVVQTSNDVRFK